MQKIRTTLITGLVILITLPVTSFAQDKSGSQEFSLSYGTTSGTDLIQGFYENSRRPNYDHPGYFQATAKTGNIFATYRYCINKRLDLGLTLGMEALSLSHYTHPDLGAPQLLGKYKASITTIAAEIKLVYCEGKVVQFYGFIGMGARYFQEKQTEYAAAGIYPQNSDLQVTPFFVNTQWTPLGLRVGKRFYGFAELGVGYKGLLNVGVCYRMDKKKTANDHKE